MHHRKLVLYIAMSLDGYIAAEDGDLSFLTKVEKEGEDYGYSKFIATVDTLIMGRKTYDKILTLGFAYPDSIKNIYIITRTPRPQQGNITFYTGDLKELIAQLRSRPGKNIFCDGGAEIVNQLLKDDLIDEMTISIIPVLLGSGISLFNSARPQAPLTLLSSRSFDTGLVQLHYTLVEL